MTKLTYLLDIAAATTAGELHELRQLAATDADLTPRERAEITDRIAATFGRWNHLAVGPQKPRWSAQGGRR